MVGVFVWIGYDGEDVLIGVPGAPGDDAATPPVGVVAPVAIAVVLGSAAAAAGHPVAAERAIADPPPPPSICWGDSDSIIDDSTAVSAKSPTSPSSIIRH